MCNLKGRRAYGVNLTLAVGLGGVLLLAGCNKEDQSAGNSGQIIGHVGKEAITTQELDNEFVWLKVPADKRKDAATIKRVIEELAVRKYLVQKAVDSKLDREPAVLLDILRSREQALASAFVSRDVSSKASAASAEDIQKYIANSPQKFAQRELFSTDQITFALGPNYPAIIKATQNIKTLDGISKKLAEMGVVHNHSSGGFSSGEISQSVFDLIREKKGDDIFFASFGPNGVFFKVTGEQPQPLEGDEAVKMARQSMAADFTKAASNTARAVVNAEAKFEGDYANIMKTPAPSIESGTGLKFGLE
jgi:EpsD family peptidyl-prolyl cis-trans isomerase